MPSGRGSGLRSSRFAGSAIAAAVLPWRKPEVYRASPIARYNVLGVPIITVAAGAFLVILGFAI